VSLLSRAVVLFCFPAKLETVLRELEWRLCCWARRESEKKVRQETVRWNGIKLQNYVWISRSENKRNFSDTFAIWRKIVQMSKLQR